MVLPVFYNMVDRVVIQQKLSQTPIVLPDIGVVKEQILQAQPNHILNDIQNIIGCV